MRDSAKEEWFHMQEGNVSGPRTFRELQRMIGEKTLQPKAMVWTESMDKWRSADEVPGLIPGFNPPEKPRLIRTSERSKIQSRAQSVRPETSRDFSPALKRTSERRETPTDASLSNHRTEDVMVPSVVEARAAGPARRFFHPPVSTGEWMWTILLASLPVINIICFLVWAFGGSTAADKANWAKATLLWWVVVILVYAVFFGLLILAPSLRASFLD